MWTGRRSSIVWETPKRLPHSGPSWSTVFINLAKAEQASITPSLAARRPDPAAQAPRADAFAGVPLQRIRPALDRLRDELGIKHVLASRKLYTDGAEVFYDCAEHAGDTPEARSARELVVVRNGQRVFNEIVDSYLTRIDFYDDQWARVIHLPKYGPTDVVVDQQRGFGAPIFANGPVMTHLRLWTEGLATAW